MLTDSFFSMYEFIICKPVALSVYEQFILYILFYDLLWLIGLSWNLFFMAMQRSALFILITCFYLTGPLLMEIMFLIFQYFKHP